MKRLRGVWWFVWALAILVLGGCLGKAPPVEEYLSVRPATGEPCAQQASPGTRVTVALKSFKAVDALDRQAVLLGRGRVMRPSLAWYWEGPPARLVEQALVQGLSCSSGVAPVWPMRSTTRADGVLTGMVNAFWVDTESRTLHAAVQVQLWDEKQVAVLASKEIFVQSPVRSLDAQGVAEAGSEALARLSGEVSAWLESVMKEGKHLPGAR